MKIEGAIVLITGAARRLGRMTALTLARAGAHLILHYHRSEKEALGLEEEILSCGVECQLIAADLSRLSEVRRLARLAYQWKKRVDVLINNASVFYPTPFGKRNEKQWEELFAVNTRAPYFLSELLGEKMRRRGRGKIINIADAAALRPYTQYVPYCASKAALIALTQGLARTLVPKVTVNAILPGPVMWPEDLGEGVKKKVLRRIPLARLGSPEDVAQTVKFLIEGTDYMTGSLVTVDGGHLLV